MIESRPPMIPDFVSEARLLLPELVELRRTLHADPELGLDLPRTQRRVCDALAGLPVEITLGKRTSSVVAVLRGALPGPTVLLRGDMDGLPLTEVTGLEYAATTGAMHACGHDLHTTGIVGAARLLSAHQAELHGSVIFMFQPGEEGFGGAQIMLEEGVLDAADSRPVAAYAIHVAPGPRGVFATRAGTATAGSNQLFITLTGSGGHGSQPHLAIDPVPVAAEIILALQTFITRRLDAFDPAVLTVTRLDSDAGAINVIPEHAHMAATVRTASEKSRHMLQQELPRLVTGIAHAHGVEAEVEFRVLYPATVNDPGETTRTIAALRNAFGESRVLTAPAPTMGSEDFAFVLNQVPGTFVGLFASPPDLDSSQIAFNHSPRVMFDDAVLADQAAALAHLAFTRTATL